MAYLNHNLPDWSCYIRNEFLYNHTQGHGKVTKCDVHCVASIEKRVPLFEAFLENGVNWTRRPLHAFCWKPDAPIEPLEDVMYWDMYNATEAAVAEVKRMKQLRREIQIERMYGQ